LDLLGFIQRAVNFADGCAFRGGGKLTRIGKALGFAPRFFSDGMASSSIRSFFFFCASNLASDTTFNLLRDEGLVNGLLNLRVFISHSAEHSTVVTLTPRFTKNFVTSAFTASAISCFFETQLSQRIHGGNLSRRLLNPSANLTIHHICQRTAGVPSTGIWRHHLRK